MDTQKKQQLTYADAGVDIAAGNKAVELIKKSVHSTKRSGVMDSIGGFGGMFALDTGKYKEPVLISGTDGVGTKLKIAHITDIHNTIGIDAVAMCVNDILVQGAEPLFFLDYLAVDKLVPEKVADIVEGIAEGCRQSGCALIGGETAEMPGFYSPGEYDIAGFVVGVADKSKIITGEQIREGDVLIGLSSTGLHSNGYSLARKALLEIAGYDMDTKLPELDCTIGEELLKPTRIYAKSVQPLLDKYNIRGMAHITGGGITENLPRILQQGQGAVVNRKTWDVPNIFKVIQKIGDTTEEEMLRTFNMGIGMVLVVAPEEVEDIMQDLKERDEDAFVIGEVTAGNRVSYE